MDVPNVSKDGFLSAVLAQAKRLDQTVAVAMLDIDHFKSINDTYGHAAGDRVLLALARLLKQRLRKSDVIARYGGEEFLVIMPYTTAENAARVMEEIRQHFASLELAGPGGIRFQCSFSAGVADQSQTAEAPTLVEYADRALYRAKDAGRNRVLLFQPAS